MESFLIVDILASKEIRLKVASAVLKAQEFREQSWNTETDKYSITKQEAVKRTIPAFIQGKEWEIIITGWLYHMWNESKIWAENVVYESAIDDTK
jgi:hypothetical protein